MAETYVARCEVEDGLASTDNFSAVGTINQPYIQQGATLGMFNTRGSGKTVAVKSIAINEVGNSFSTWPNYGRIQRTTTATSGGENISIIALDTSTSLPSQVSFTRYGDGQGSGNIRTVYINPTAASGQALRETVARRIGASVGWNPVSCFSNRADYTNHFSDVQTIVLRENEGVMFSATFLTPVPLPLEVSVWFSDGTDSFLARTVVSTVYADRLWCLYNGSGSGVVLNVSRIETQMIKDFVTTGAQNLEIQTISDMGYGVDVTPIPLDSTNTLSDSSIKIQKNPGVLTQGPDSAFSNRPGRGDSTLRRMNAAFWGTYPNSGNKIARIDTASTNAHVFDFSPSVDSSGGFILREGEGFAIFQKGSFPLLTAWNYEYVITYTVAGDPSPVYPVEDDVEVGVTYGPTGTDYTGTVTLPDEAEVETGVQYGADGTEFTGTLSGGGGGEHSSTFVV